MEFISESNPGMTDAMKQYAEDKISKAQRYLSKEAFDKILIKYAKYVNTFKAEVSLDFENIHFRVTETGSDFYKLIDELEDRFVRKIRKYRTAVEKKILGASKKFYSEVAEQEENEESDPISITKDKIAILTSESVYDAIDDMNEMEYDFYVYRDIDRADAICAIYKRANGEYGVIEFK